MNKRYYIEHITGSNQIRIIDRLTHKSAIVNTYDDSINYFIDELNRLDDELQSSKGYCADLETNLKKIIELHKNEEKQNVNFEINIDNNLTEKEFVEIIRQKMLKAKKGAIELLTRKKWRGD